MIVIVNAQTAPAQVTAVADGEAEVTVQVTYSSLRTEVDQALRASGAGCLPGHNAELSVSWLLAAYQSWPAGPLDCAKLGSSPELSWLRPDRLDETGDWLAAPVEWLTTSDADDWFAEWTEIVVA